MKRLLLCLALLTGFAAAQIDINVSTVGQIRNLVTNALWATSGTSNGTPGINNNFIFTPTFTNEGACFQLVNSDPTNTQSAIVNFFGTSNQNTIAFQGNRSQWAQLGPGAGLPISSGGINLPPNTTRQFFVQINGQARVVIALTPQAGTATATATLNVVETQNSGGCGNVSTNPISCPFVATQSTVASGATVTLIPAGTPTQGTYICNLVVTSSTAATASNTGFVIGYQASTCTAPATIFSVATPASPVNINLSGTPLISRFANGTADQVGDLICVTNNSSVTENIVATYAQF